MPPFAPTSRRSPDGGARLPTPRRPSPPACGWLAPPTTSAGPMTACAGSPPTTPRASGFTAPRPWRPASPTTAGPWTNYSASRSPYRAGSRANDAADRPNIHLLERRHDHGSVGSYPEVDQREVILPGVLVNPGAAPHDLLELR